MNYSPLFVCREVENSRSVLKDMDEDELDAFVDAQADKVQRNLTDQVDRLRKTIKSKKPKKPTKEECATEEEYAQKSKEYEEKKEAYSKFVQWSTLILNKVAEWVTEICNRIIGLFHQLWTWICGKIADIASKVQQAILVIKEQMDTFLQFIFQYI